MIDLPSIISNHLQLWLMAFVVIVALVGLARGFFKQILGLVSSVGALVLAVIFSGLMARQLSFVKLGINTGVEGIDQALNHYILIAIAFLSIFVGVKVMVLFLNPVFKKIAEVPFIKQANHFLGVVVGAINGFLWALILALLISLPIFKNGQEVVQQTFFGQFLNQVPTITDTAKTHLSALSFLYSAKSGEDLTNEQWQTLTAWLNQNLPEPYTAQDVYVKLGIQMSD